MARIVDSINTARSRGATDDSILAQIERQNPKKRSVFSQARERGASSSQIIEEIIKQNSNQGFIRETIGDVRETVRDVGRSIGSFFTRQSETAQGAARGEQDITRSRGQSLGNILGTASRILGDTVIGAGKVLLPERAERFVGDVARKAAEPLARPIATAQQKVAEIEQRDPALARDLKAAGGIASFAGDVAGGKIGSIATRAVRTAPLRVGSAIKNSSTARLVGTTATSQMTGLSPQTIRTIVSRPGDFTSFRASESDRLTLANRIHSAITKRDEELSDLGKGYEPIRNSGQVVDFGDDIVESAIRGSGFDIVDGVITPGTKSLTRNKADIRAIQDFYDNWSDRSTLDAEEYLNMRSDLAELAKFDRISGKSNKSEEFAKALRTKVNEFRDQIDGLKEIDTQFAPERQFLGKIRKEFLDKDGNLKDAAINRIANAVGKGKDRVLARLVKLVPDIEDQLKLLKAVEDIEYASGQKVGTYARAFLGIGVGLQNPLAGILSFLLTTPEMFVSYALWFARTKGKSEAVAKAIAQKIKDGIPLGPKERQLVADALKQAPRLFGQFIDTVGAGVGVAADETTQK